MEFFNNICNLDFISKNICRICIREVDQIIHLFSESPESVDILSKLNSCFQIVLSFQRHFPPGICSECVKELNIAHNFHQKCISFEERYAAITNKYILNNTNSVPNVKCDNTSDKEIIDEDYTDNIYEKVKDCEVDIMSIIKFPCSICNKILKSKASLIRHNVCMHQKRKHPGKVIGFGAERRYHCTKCSYFTPHSQTLVNHMRRHNGDRPHMCECGKGFTQSSSLTAHRKTHSNLTYFTCSVCGKQFKHAFSLKNHQRVHGTGHFSCDICQKQLKSKQSLQDHMYRHYSIKNYNCEDCGATFVTRSELLNHKKKHGIVKSLECHLCGYKTNTKKNLIIHLKRHAGDKSFKCEFCQISFYTNGDLQRHARVHTHDKPYPCPTCTQRFAHSNSLNKHMNNIHGVKFKWADIKWKEIKKAKFEKAFLDINVK